MTYRIFNKGTLVVEESIHMFDEANNLFSRKKDTIDDTSILENRIKELNLKEKPSQDGGEETKDDEEVLNLKKSMNKEHKDLPKE